MTPLRLVVQLAVALAALFAGTAEAYQHFGETVGSQVLVQHWRTFPIAVTVDSGPTNLLTEINTAVATWNAVPTAKDPWGTVTAAGVDFTKDNLGTAWGNLDGDGKQEVVVDEDGSIFRSLGIAPASANGMGVSAGVIDRGEAVINDMYLLINGSRTNFDRRATEVHELGHTLGLAHSSVGWATGKDGALSPELEAAVPTMHPFSISTNDRQSLEADDEASLSELYPQPSFHTTTGTITGFVTRCGTGEPVLGANVRAISVADPTIQMSRYTGFDGKTDGSYEINGVPPGDYDVVVEPLAGDTFYLDRLTTFTRIDTDFTQEFLNKTKEGDCAQDTDPNEHESIPVGASGTVPADFKVEGSSLALVIDITGSMGPEITDIKAGLNTMISTLESLGVPFPKTAIVTFDDRATIATVSRDPQRLRTVIDGLTTHSTPDCPEGANAALMTAGRLLGSGGRAILVTDADSHPTGPSREAVDASYRAKGARLSVLLSGSCPPPPASAARVQAAPDFGGTADAPGPDEAKPADVLGVEGSVRTFSEESLFSGGLFSFQPEVKTGGADIHTRYANTLANVGISAVVGAVAALSPSAVPQGSSLAVELTGSDTGFRAGSAVTVGGAGVSVDSVAVLGPTRLVVRLTAAPGAATGFRDVTVTTPRGDGTTETARGFGALQVVGAPSSPTVLSVVPSTVAAGETRDVEISGALTHFGGGSVASLGPGVTVNRLTVRSPTSAVANVTVGAGAAVGFRDVTVQTGGELAGESVPGPFLVTAAPPAIARLVGASPSGAARGATVDVALTGANTAFAAGRSVASVSGGGVQVVSTTVSSPTAAVARLRIASDAPLGFRDVKVTTGAEDAALLDGFEVLPAGGQAPPPGGPPAPGVPPGRPACTDRTPPSASLRSVTVRRGRLRLSGRASDAGCGAAVARVEVSISRAAGRRRCRFVDARGRLTRARSCARPVRLRATGRTSWSLATKRRLPRGSYAIQVRAVDAAGNVQARPARRTQRVR